MGKKRTQEHVVNIPKNMKESSVSAYVYLNLLAIADPSLEWKRIIRKGVELQPSEDVHEGETIVLSM